MLERLADLQRSYKAQVVVMFSVLLFLSGQGSLLMGATGALTQLSGLSACVSNTGTNGACVQGQGLNGAAWVEVSRDGNFAYVASPNSSTVTTFSRNPSTGALTQLAGTQGCVGDTGNGVTCAHGNGLSGAVSLALSPDGNQLYEVSRNNSLAIFSRNTSTGVLTQLPGTAGCIADPGDGVVCAQAHALGGPRSVTVSPDGNNVYVGARDGGAVAVFSRNLKTGVLTQLVGSAGCVSKDGTGGLCAQGRGLVGAREVFVSPDNRNAYVASEGDINGNSALAVFSRDTTTGALTQLSGPAGCFAVNGDGVTCTLARGLVTAISPVVSPDGNSVYVAARDSNSLAIFSRNTATGALSQLSGPAGCFMENGDGVNCAAGRGLTQAVFVRVSPDGTNVYTAAQVGNAVTVFSRNVTTSALTQLSGTAGCTSDGGTEGCQTGKALIGAVSLTVTSDSKNVYVAAYADNLTNGSVAAFSRDAGTLPPCSLCVTAISPNTVNLAAPPTGFAITGAGFASTGFGLPLVDFSLNGFVLAQVRATAIGGSTSLTVPYPAGLMDGSVDAQVFNQISSNQLMFVGSTPLSVTGTSLASNGALTQLSGTSGCISDTGTGGSCTHGTGLSGAGWLDISPDGKFIYVASSASSTVTTFSRNSTTGVLTQLSGTQGCIADGGGVGCAAGIGLSGAVSVAVSPDGNHVYVASAGNSVAVFSRNTVTGVLTQLSGTAGCIAQSGSNPSCANANALVGPRSIAVSPDGKSVYVGARNGNAVAIFSRNATTGVLTQLSGLAGCVSSDGTGGLCTQGRGLLGARGVTVSPDNRQVYVASQNDNALAVFSRDTTTGALTQLSGPAGCISATGDGVNCAPGRGLLNPIELRVSLDGKNVYAAAVGSSAISVFSRDTGTGALTQLSGPAGCIAETGDGVTCADGAGLGQVVFVTVSPDGSSVYGAAQVSNAVTVFSRNATTGQLNPLAGLQACVSSDGTDGSCAIGLALDGAISVVTSPDGKNVYLASSVGNAVLAFNRTALAPPTVVTAAAATPSPVTAKTTNLTALGADSAGEATLAYTWATTGTPPAAVTFSANGTNAAKSTVATFTKAGSYNFTVTIMDQLGLTVTSSVNVTVNATLTSISVAPSSATVSIGATQPFTAAASDQFNALLVPQPSFTWTVSGGGTISSAGLFTAGSTSGGPFTVTAASGGINGTATLSVTANAPTVATPATATPNPVTAKTTNLTVLGADAAGEANLVYTWATTGTPPAAVTFSANGTNAAKSTVATFTKAGSYSFAVTIKNLANLTVTSPVNVTVNATLTSISLAPPSVTVAPGATQPFTATASDQFNVLLASQPSFTWTVSGGGTISSAGLFTAGSTAGGPFTVTAASGAVNGTATVSVATANSAPTSVILVSVPNPSLAGALVTFTATVSGPGSVVSSNFAAPAENPLSESGAWKSPINPSSSVALQKDAASHVFPTAVNKDSAARYVGRTFSGDQFSQATIANRGGSTVEGVLARIQGNTNGSSYFFGSFYGDFYSIIRVADNNSEMHFVQNSDSFGGGRLLDINVKPKAGDVVREEVSGSPNPTIKVYVNGLLLATVVDTGTSDRLGTYPPLSSGQPGIYAFLSSGAVTSTELTNWSGGDLGGVGTGGTLTGTVNFMEGTAVLGSGTLNGSAQATYSTSSLIAGPHSITAVYAGNSTFAGSTSPAVNQVVNSPLTSTTTALTSSLNPSNAGQSVIFTATVTAAAGNPSGTVNFLDGTTSVGSGTLNSAGQATFTTSSLTVATHSITAVYAGNSTFAASTSPAVNQVVKAVTTTALTSSLNPSNAGQPVTFTATVTAGGSGTPSGTVSFLDGTTLIGSGTLNGSGQAAFTTSSLTVATHSITAVYGGTATFAASTSPAVNEVVNAVTLTSTTTAVISSLNPSNAGQSVTFTATVTAGGSGTLSGTVSFLDGTALIGSGTLNASAQATYTTSSLTAATHSITAVYGGNASFAASTSPAVNQVVNALTSTTTALTSSLNPSNTGQSVTFTATVTAASGNPSGTVSFLDGTTAIGSGTLNGSGQATYTTSSLTAAIHPITAVYAGNVTFAPSTSPAVNQVVNGTGTSTSTMVTSSVQPSETGQSVTLTATVSAASGTPSGTVTFMDGSVSLGSRTLSARTASLATSSLASGYHVITAVYSGGGTFAASTSPIFYQVVITRGQARSVTSVTSSTNPSTTGQNVTLRATVSASGGYTGSSTFDGPAQNPLSDGGRWITPVNPATTLALQSDGNHNILESGSNKAGVARYVGQVFLDDQFAQATISSRGGSTLEGVFVRMQSDTNPSGYAALDFYGQWYSIARFDNAAGEFRIIQTSDSFGGRLKDFAVVPKAGDVVRLGISGTTNPTLTLWVNGNLVGSSVDTGASDWNGTYPPLSGGLPGVYLFKSSGSVNPGLSNWSAGDLSAPSGVTVPTGAVTFIDGTTVLATVSLNGAGQATLDISTLSASSHSIIAVYGGDTNYVGSSSPGLGQVVTAP